MSGPAAPAANPRAPSFAYLIIVLLLAQALGTMATSLVPAMAPKVVASYGVSSVWIGYQVSLIDRKSTRLNSSH